MRKLFFLFLVLIATINLYAYDFQFGDLYYNITSDDEVYTVEVTYQEESAYNYIMLDSAIIPETVTYNDITYSVTSIGKAAFKDCFSLVVVTLPKSIVSIHEEAFYKCTSLSSITMENGITNIEKSAFRYCKSLTSITIPSSITKIGKEVFRNCSSLESIIWNAKGYVDAVYASPFSDIASQITSFTFGDNIECIPAFLCDGMQKLTSITIPNTVVTMGDNVFRGCSSLNMVTIGNAVKNIGNRAFYTCKSLTSIVIPNSVITIEDGAFWGCTALSSVVVGNSVERIGEYAFSDCSSLSSIIISNSVKEIGSRAFYNCSLLDSICLGNSIETIAAEAFCGCSSLKSINIPSSVLRIEGGVFEATGIYQNESNWENDVLYIGDCLIEAKSSISDRYTIKNGTRLIAGGAFNFSHSLSSIIIPNSVTSIGYRAFYNCTSLDSIDIPNSVTSIGGGAFEATGIYKNKSNWEDNVLYISNCLIAAHNIQLNTYSIKENTRVIADEAFYNNSYVISITIPKSVTHIGYNVFSYCYMLDTLYSYATTPPIVDTYLCNTDLYELLSLFVPCSTIANYQTDAIWGQIANIYCLDSETTYVEELSNEKFQNNQKLLHNGQLLILRDGKTYTITGQKL